MAGRGRRFRCTRNQHAGTPPRARGWGCPPCHACAIREPNRRIDWRGLRALLQVLARVINKQTRSGKTSVELSVRALEAQPGQFMADPDAFMAHAEGLLQQQQQQQQVSAL